MDNNNQNTNQNTNQNPQPQPQPKNEVEEKKEKMKKEREDNILFKNDYENTDFSYKYIFINPRNDGTIPDCCNPHDKYYGVRCFLYCCAFFIVNCIYFLFGCFFYFCASCWACFCNWKCCCFDCCLRPIERCCLAWYFNFQSLYLLLRKIFCFPCWVFKDCRACWKDIFYDSKDYAFRALSTYEHSWDCCYVRIFQEGEHFKESVIMGKDWEDQIRLGGITLESNDSNTILEYTRIYF